MQKKYIYAPLKYEKQIIFSFQIDAGLSEQQFITLWEILSE